MDNAHSDEARVKVAIVHQKRHKKGEEWQDAPNFNAATMKAGQEIKLALNTAETFQLYQTLKGLYAVTKDGIPRKDGTLVVIDESQGFAVEGRAADPLVRRLTERSSDEFWDAIHKLEPNLFQAVALTKLHEIRETAVQEYDEHLKADDWGEGDWQAFFENNTSIFGLPARLPLPIADRATTLLRRQDRQGERRPPRRLPDRSHRRSAVHSPRREQTTRQPARGEWGVPQ